ncbi:site-specific integrase, partial [Lactiplantibacillus plantarum]|nr:site-specific integrase [Lactiplantibacillus plantarum]
MAQHVKFHQYFFQWMQLYKLDAVRPVTYRKYEMSHRQLVTLAPDLKMADLSRLTYQQLLNDYAETHERQTTMDFHRHLKGSLIDALEEGFIDRDPTRKAIIKGIKHRQHKTKYLHQYELQALLNELNLNNEVNWDYFIL